MSGDDMNHMVDEALGALPERAPDPLSAERVRLRARLELGRSRGSRRGRALGRMWYLAEPFVVGAVVLAFLGWTFLQVSIILM